MCNTIHSFSRAVRVLGLFCAWPAFLSTPGWAEIPVALGATIGASTTVSATYHVAPSGDNADSGSGTAPWKTIGFAAKKAFERQAQGQSTRVFIRNGTYRENVGLFDQAVRNNAAVIFQGESANNVIVTGAERVTGWMQSGARWHAPWVHDWGTQPWDFGNGSPKPGPVVHRNEVLFLDDTLLRQVLSPGELAPGTFFVDEAADKIWMQPPPGQTMSASANVTASLHGSLWRIENKNNLVLSNLTFKRDNSRYSSTWAAVRVMRCDNVLVENCRFVENNNVGFYLAAGCDNATIRNSEFSDNGHFGLQTKYNKNLLVEYCRMDRNNWRGQWGDYVTWSPCGFKAMFSRRATWRRNRADNNFGVGMWWDTDNVDLRIEDNFAKNNLQLGFYIEYNQGPVLATRNIASGNNLGFMVDASTHVTLEKNIAWNNNGWAFKVRKTANRGDSMNFETNQELVLSTAHLTLRRNVFVGTGGRQAALSVLPPSYLNNLFTSSFSSDYNAFWAVSYAQPFQIGDPRHDFSGYKAASGQDAHSTWGDPRFVDPAGDDFRVQAGSPVAGWGLPTAPFAVGVVVSPAPTPTPGLVNLALNKSATQSSTPPGTTATANNAALAIDNNTDGDWRRGSVTHTGLDKEAWWQVDLGASRAITTIDLFNRTDGSGERLSNFHVFVSDTPFPSGDLQTLLAQPHVWRFHSGIAAGRPSTVSVHRMGRYVRVQLTNTSCLSLAEVKVNGYGDVLPNLALNKTASQSSRPQGAPAPGAAVDNNTNGLWSGGSITHTHLETNPWWQLDLGQSHTIATLNLFNRTDNNQQRLSRVHVFVSDTPFTSGDLTATLKQSDVWHGYVAGTVGAPTSIPVHRRGRYLRVQLAGMGYLSLAEVQVLGFPNPNPNANLAQNKTTAQSSRPQGTPTSGAAVDGNTSGVWMGGSITHTHLEKEPWWQVDLGQSHSLTHVELFNRTDNATERLGNLTVLVSDAPFASTNLQATLQQPGVTATLLPVQVGTPTSVPVHRTGRYVRIQLVGTNYLSLAEVKVMGLSINGAAVAIAAAAAEPRVVALGQRPFPLATIAAKGVDRDAPAAQKPHLAGRLKKATVNAKPVVAGAAPSRGWGAGLLGEYFDNQNGTRRVTVRIDKKIDFDWGRNTPPGTALTSPDNFSVRWSGWVEAPASGTYTFTTTSDDGIRLWVNGKLLVNRPLWRTPYDDSGTIFLHAGRRYPVRIEYIEGGLSAQAKLWWAYSGQPKQIVPTHWLHPSR